MSDKTQRGLKLISLTGENVYTYREPFSLMLDQQGLVYVTGKNLDTEVPSSSGAGKSRLFSLIPRALYGREALSKEPVSAIWAADGTAGFYELVYWVDGTYYMVREESGAKSAKLSFFTRPSLAEGDWTPIGARNKKTGLQAEITASVQRPMDEFLGTVVWKQGHGHVLLQGTPSERITWLSSLFGLSKYDLIHDAIVEDIADNKKKQEEFLPFVGAHAQAKSVVDSFGDPAELQMQLDRLVALAATHIATRTNLTAKCTALTQELTAARASVSNRAKLNGHSVNDVLVAGDRVHEFTSELTVVSKAHRDLTAKISAYQVAHPIIVAFATVPSAIKDKLAQDPSYSSTLRDRLAQLNAELFALARDEGQLGEQQRCRAKYAHILRQLYPGLVSEGINPQALGSVASATEEIERIRVALVSASNAAAVLDSQFASFSKLSSLGGKCPSCGSDVDQAHATSEMDRIRALMASPDGAHATHRQLSAQLSSLERYLKELRGYESYPPVSDDDLAQLRIKQEAIAPVVAEIKQQITDADAALSIVSRYSAIAPDILTFDLAASQAEAAFLADSERELTDRIAYHQRLHALASLDMSKDDSDVSRLQLELSETNTALESIQTIYSDTIRDQAVVEHKIKQYSLALTELDRLNTLHTKYTELVRVGAWLKSTQKAYSKQGFKQHKLRHLLELIKEKLPVWTKLLFTESNVSIGISGDESKISLVVNQQADPDGSGRIVEKTYDVSEMSGGEQSKLAICIMLTLIDIVSDERKCNVAILDEVDRHMDKNALRLMSDHLIRNLAARRSSIFLVSHQIPLSSEFSKELTVTKRRACSSIELRDLQTT